MCHCQVISILEVSVNYKKFRTVLFLLLLLTLTPAASVRAQELDDRALLLIRYTARTELERLAGRLDVWEVRPGEEEDKGRVLAYVSAGERAWLRSLGFTFETLPLPEVGVGPDALLDYACYRTIDQLYADLQVVHTDHPSITALMHIGESYEGRDIWVLRITNQAIAGPKPTLFVIANVHGREIITNELAMVFIDYLTDNYGIDPDVTWLLDHHEIHVSASTNPDGHVKNEPPGAYWRKNTNPTHGCSTSYGVDLNRNSTFGWHICGNEYCSSGYPCAQTYRGPSAGSESETQAVEAYARSIFPDQREDALDAAAPLTATGVFITLHSYSNLVLWPWGHTDDPAPNAAGLAALGCKMASYNGYTPKQASGLYRTDGTTDDWTYGALGIASYTFEIGSSSDYFYPPCSRYDALIQPNIPALLYAAKAARTPYLTAHGPDARAVSTTVDGTLRGATVRLTAEIDDRDNGGDRIARAEYYVDAPPWAGGVGAPMTAVDGAFDAPVEQVEAWAPTAGWTPGRHLVFVRGQDEAGYWGPFSATFLTVYTDVVATGVITGQVSGPSGDGLAGANVRFESVGERAGQRFETVTGVDGLYRVTVLSGTYTGTAGALAHYPQTITGVVATAGTTTTQAFSLDGWPRLYLPCLMRG